MRQEEAQGEPPRSRPPGPLELSLVLCDDAHMAALNLEWRGVAGPTDVLSFEMQGDEEDEDWGQGGADSPEEEQGGEGEEEEGAQGEGQEGVDVDAAAGGDCPPATLLGDVVISLDTAARQAQERGHSLEAECRVLLVHGVLHLLGYDHEQGERGCEHAAAAVAAARPSCALLRAQ